MFQKGDVIQHPKGGAKYRILLVDEDQNAYKVVRLDNYEMTLIGIDKGYVPTEAPQETLYQVGQILLKKQGPPNVAVICKVIPGADKNYHEYLICFYDIKGNLTSSSILTEKEVSRELVITDFKWVIMYGDPKKIVRKAVQDRIEKLEKDLFEQRNLLNSLVYYETILEEGKSNS